MPFILLFTFQTAACGIGVSNGKTSMELNAQPFRPMILLAFAYFMRSIKARNSLGSGHP